MAWLRQRGKSDGDAWSMEESARKRRKLEKEEKEEGGSRGKDDWDDSMELTQAELETLDVIASQAVVEDAPAVSHEEKTTETALAEDQLFFAKPSLRPHSFARRSTSSSSGSSAHPVSLTSRSSSDASGSLSSHTSENGKTDVPVDTVQTLRAKLEEQIKKSQEERFRSAGEMAFLRESLRRQEEELEKVREERDTGLEKEKLTQRESEKVLHTKIDSMMSEAQFKDRDFKNLQEQYQALQIKLKKLEQEKQQQPSTNNAPLSPSTKMPSPRKIPVRPSPPSKQKVKQTEETGLQGKSFPTRHTFMEQPSSSFRGSPTKMSSPGAGSSTTDSVTVTAKKSRRLKLKMPSLLDAETVSGTQVVQHLLTSPQVHQLPGALATEDWDPGLMGLMHAMSTTLRVAGLNYSRTGGSGVPALSPVKPRGHTPKKLNKDENGGTLQIVSKEHFQLAVDGLSQLLDVRITESTRAHGEGRTLKADLPRKATGDDLTDLNKNRSNHTNEQDLSRSRSEKHIKFLSNGIALPAEAQASRSAALILPLLTDYIQHYVDLLSCPHTRSASGLTRSQHHPLSPYHSTLESTSHSATGSSSFESSLDSLNSSVLQLLHDGHVYAAGIEGYTCAALRCVTLLLLLCPSLGEFILAPHIRLKASTSAFTSSTSGNSSTVETDAKSEVEADDEKSVSSCEIRILAAACERASTQSPECKPRIQSPVLFHLLLQLASQDLKDSSCAPGVVAQALHVLTLLCQSCLDEHIPKLENIAVRGILTNCLRHTSHIAVPVWAARLLQSLAGHSNLFTRLCTKSENCPLFLMHQVNSLKDLKVKQDDMVVFYKEYICCLSSVIAQQQQGLQKLLSNACPCSNELVPGIVLAMYKLFRVYQERKRSKESHQRPSPTPSLQTLDPVSPSQLKEECGFFLWALGQGVTLLHAVAQADSAFLQHHSPVQPQYVILLSGLKVVLKATVGWEFHLSALEELCDFDPDLSDLSQESESDEKMDQS